MIADRARVPVWELDDVPSWWVARIRVAIVAENRAAEERHLRDARRAKSRGGASRGGSLSRRR